VAVCPVGGIVFDLLGSESRAQVSADDVFDCRRQSYGILGIAADNRVVGLVLRCRIEALEDAGMTPCVTTRCKMER
jgi:hypothetical protein